MDQDSPDAQGSPLAPNRLKELYFRPSIFFDPARALGGKPELYVVIWFIGMLAVSDRIDQRLMRGSASATLVSDSWTFMWLAMLIGGVLSGAFAWYIQGWWYRKRLEWSGAVDPDRDRVRHVWAYVNFVVALPAVLSMVTQTVQYDSYTEAWEDGALIGLVVLVALFWSVYTSYRAVRTNWKVRPGAARVWFIALPVVVYLFAIGLYSAIDSLRT